MRRHSLFIVLWLVVNSIGMGVWGWGWRRLMLAFDPGHLVQVVLLSFLLPFLQAIVLAQKGTVGRWFGLWVPMSVLSWGAAVVLGLPFAGGMAGMVMLVGGGVWPAVGVVLGVLTAPAVLGALCGLALGCGQGWVWRQMSRPLPDWCWRCGLAGGVGGPVFLGLMLWLGNGIVSGLVVGVLLAISTLPLLLDQEHGL